MKYLVFLLLVLFLMVPAALVQAQSSMGIFDTLKLKDFHPQSRLEIPSHIVLRPKYPVIDTHSHAYKRGEDIHELVKTMKACNVRKVVVQMYKSFDGTLDEILEDYLGKYPDHFQVWGQIDDRDIETSDYPSRASRSVEEMFRKGVRGIGEYKDMGPGFGGDPKNGRKGWNIDDPRLDLALETAGRLGMPVSIHTADMEDCYYPLTANSDLGTAGAPWNVYDEIGKNFIMPRAQVMNTRNRALAKHPNTIFIGCHLGNLSHDLGELGRLLDLYPNYYIDISARAWDLGRQPFTARKFFIKYQDRILFGTDLGPSEDMYRGWYRLLETEDEFFRVPDATWWMNYGLNMPDEVLRKIYYGNAERILKDMGTGAW